MRTGVGSKRSSKPPEDPQKGRRKFHFPLEPPLTDALPRFKPSTQKSTTMEYRSTEYVSQSNSREKTLSMPILLLFPFYEATIDLRIQR